MLNSVRTVHVHEVFVVGLTAVAITCDVSDVMTRSRVLARSWVEFLTCCTKPEVSSKSAKFVASVQVGSPYRVLKSPHTTVSVGWTAAMSNTFPTSSRKERKSDVGGR